MTTIIRDSFTIYPSRDAAVAAAERFQAVDEDGWTYAPVEVSRGYTVSAFDEDGAFVANMQDMK